jgi:hypothetical protein
VNLYVLLAIALGAFTGFSEAPVAPRVFAQVVDVRSKRTGRRQIAGIRAAFARIVRSRIVRPAILTFARIEAPLSGSASPRAPAI